MQYRRYSQPLAGVAAYLTPAEIARALGATYARRPGQPWSGPRDARGRCPLGNAIAPDAVAAAIAAGALPPGAWIGAAPEPEHLADLFAFRRGVGADDDACDRILDDVSDFLEDWDQGTIRNLRAALLGPARAAPDGGRGA